MGGSKQALRLGFFVFASLSSLNTDISKYNKYKDNNDYRNYDRVCIGSAYLRALCGPNRFDEEETKQALTSKKAQI